METEGRCWSNREKEAFRSAETGRGRVRGPKAPGILRRLVGVWGVKIRSEAV